MSDTQTRTPAVAGPGRLLVVAAVPLVAFVAMTHTTKVGDTAASMTSPQWVIGRFSRCSLHACGCCRSSLRPRPSVQSWNRYWNDVYPGERRRAQRVLSGRGSVTGGRLCDRIGVRDGDESGAGEGR